MNDFSRDVAIVSGSAAISAILDRLCTQTGMGFAAVARVTDRRWIACQVVDRIGFGMEPGGELKIKTTICDEIRQTGIPVFIDCVANEPMWRTHPTPILYGFQSYVSVPIHRADGSFFGTLCAIDPDPHQVSTPELMSSIQALAAEAACCLDAENVAG